MPLGVSGPTRRRNPRCRPRVDSFSLVVASCACDCPAAGSSQPGKRGANECAWPRRGELALARDSTHVVRNHVRVAEGTDNHLEPVRLRAISAHGGRIMTLTTTYPCAWWMSASTKLTR